MARVHELRRWIPLATIERDWLVARADVKLLVNSGVVGVGCIGGTIFLDLDALESAIEKVTPQRALTLLDAAEIARQEQRLLTLNEAAVQSGVGPATLRDAIVSNELRAQRKTASLRSPYEIDQEDLAAWNAARSADSSKILTAARERVAQIRKNAHRSA